MVGCGVGEAYRESADTVAKVLPVRLEEWTSGRRTPPILLAMLGFIIFSVWPALINGGC